MSNRKVLVASLALVTSIFTVTGSVYGDSPTDGSRGSENQADDSQRSKVLNDPRLPPLIPGEEVTGEDGQKMKVWSSSGPVPREATPVPQQIDGVGVIVDPYAGRPRRW